MDKLNQKHQKLVQALATLEKALNFFTLFTKEGKSHNPHMNYEEEYRLHRDSVTQRFEYSTDLFWKYLKKYLETVHIMSGIKIPGEVVRECHSVEILNADETEQILKMIKDRNLTSHIYIEEIAEELSSRIPGYYRVMHDVTERLIPKKD